MSERIEIRTLTDGGQQPPEIAHAVAAFLDGASSTLDLAQYDFNLGPETAAIVGDAMRRAAGRGVQIRFAYNVDHANPIPVPPPPEPDAQLIASLPVEGKAIAGIPDLMHHKYVDPRRRDVWTGSLNWTDDSWSRQENVVAVVHSAAIAKAYRIDFDQLWSTGDVMKTGFVDPRWDDGVRAWFTPGHGEDLSARIAKLIRRAKRRVRICSPVITTGPVLGTLAQVIADGRVDIAGCVDVTQIREVIHQWRDERQRLVEAAAARAGDGRAVHRQGVDAVRRRDGARLHAREGDACATTRCSSARSTSRAAARRTPRTCSRSRTRRSPSGSRRSSTRCARATRAVTSAASARARPAAAAAP